MRDGRASRGGNCWGCRWGWLAGGGLIVAAWWTGSCRYDRTDRWGDQQTQPVSPSYECTVGELRCTSALQRCAQKSGGGTGWVVLDDCAARGLVCAQSLLKCVRCRPYERSCQGQDVMVCAPDGSGLRKAETCTPATGIACRSGVCADLCGEAEKLKSNVGCEYWAVDLDNANISATSSAASQQYAIVVSNPQPDIAAHVVIEQDDSMPGEPQRLSIAAEDDIPPSNLRVFRLGPREVDGSAHGEFNTGAGTAWTRAAYRVRSHVPVVAYQFNPLDNANVFSNDASLLKPVEAVTYTPGNLVPAYVVLGWPQTIAHTDDPDTNFDPNNPIDLRAFVSIVGTRDETHVRFTSSTRVIPGVGLPELQRGGVLDVTIQPFEVLNLETGGFNADFSGSLIEADQPVIVFTGSEASDAPYFTKLSDRYCCADHLEEQLDPVRTAGRRFVAAHAPNRSKVVAEAGASLSGSVDEPEFFRLISVTTEPAVVKTSLPAPDDTFTMSGRGEIRDIRAYRNFIVESDQPLMLASVQASQDAAGVKRGLPGGDPSLLIIPPIEQYRADYVFLTPDKYAFDFIVIAAPPEAVVLLDGASMTDAGCTKSPGDGLSDEDRGTSTPPYVVYTCQLSFPVVDQTKAPPNNINPGFQNDGVHRVQSDRDVMVLVYGFDHYVSYAYAAGTKLEALSVQ